MQTPKLTMTLDLPNVQATQKIAAAFATTLRVPAVIFLSGTLGSGKTSFVQGFFRALGFKATVRSPTFAIVESYSFQEINDVLAQQYPHSYIYHFDFYRMDKPEALEAFGIREYLHGDNLIFIEWPALTCALGLKADLCIQLDYLEQGRKFYCTAESALGQGWLESCLNDYMK